MSKASLHTMNDTMNSNGRNPLQQESNDVMSRIFHILRDYVAITKQSSMEIQVCEAMILRKGYTIQQLQSCLQEYELLDVLQFNHTKTHIHFIDGVI
jgi:hypothetical protein